MAVDRTLFSRYELKYWLPLRLVPDLRRHLRPFCRPDRHAEGKPGNRYTISSLYLDNPAFDLYRTTVEGHTNRFKLRIRSYTDNPSSPVFFEIKKRSNQVVRKKRAVVPRPYAEEFLNGQSVPPLSDDFKEFVQSCQRMDARPTLRVRYQREAYESRSGDPVRVTIDYDVEHAVTSRPDISVNGTGWCDTPMEGTILEIKFTDRAPAWVSGMVRTLGLERLSIPKYVLSLDKVFETRGRVPWSRPIAARA